MHTEFVARRSVRILGIDYEPGEVIDDGNIPASVLATLTSTRRILQRIQNDDGTPNPEARFPIDATGARRLPPVTATPETSVPVFQPRRPQEPSDGPPAPGPAPDGSEPAPPPGDAGEPSQPLPVAADAGDADEIFEDEPDPQPWREAWQHGKGVRQTFTGTFRSYLMARAAKAKLITTGSVRDLLFRLTDAEIDP